MISFDGHDFESLFVVGDPEITVLDSRAEYAESSNRNGIALIGRRWGEVHVSFSLAVLGDANSRRVALSTLGSWLDVDEPKKLVLPDTPTWYYMAIPDGALELERAIGAESTQITFTLTDPIAYSSTETTVTLSSGGSVTFTVGGTAAAKPSLQASSAKRDTTSLVWGVKLDDGDFVHVATGSNSARNTVVDCDTRTVTVSGNPAILTLDSDWLEFSPGSHTLVMDNGTGSCTVKYRERWL